jgi:hypothetical protein
MHHVNSSEGFTVLLQLDFQFVNPDLFLITSERVRLAEKLY